MTGPFERVEAGQYEAPTAVCLENGKWCLFLDYYGVPGEGQGYVPFVADSLASGRFVRSDESFHFPYGFMLGRIIMICWEEFEWIRKAFS